MTDHSAALDALRRARTERDAARNALYALRLRRLTVARAKQSDRDLDARIDAQQKIVDGLEAGVRGATDGLLAGQTPQRLIESWDDGIPILLLPLRIETRWKTDAAPPASPELWLRVYPDDIEITTHEKVLTSAEVEYGRAYWTACRGAGTDAQGLAWRTLAGRFGANRAAWVSLQTQPVNWSTASTSTDIELQFPDVPFTKPDSWTEAPHSRVLPDRFVLLAWRGDAIVVSQVGEPISDVVVVGPAPLATSDGAPSITRDAADATLSLGSEFGWVRDFDLAVSSGMAFRVPVGAADIAGGFDRLLVLGLKLTASASDAQLLIQELIDGHRYAIPGFELLQQGTPTNNTGGNDSGYSRDASDESAESEASPAKFAPVADRSLACDGQRLADFLGIDYTPLLHATGADRADHAEGVAMNRALYAGTLGYYTDHMLNEVLDESALGALRSHFTDLVTGRGPIAAIRVGKQPYGILPTSSLARWRPSRTSDPFESALLRGLVRFDSAWSTLLPGLTQVGSAGNGAANLLDVLGLQPTSAELYQRVGYSFDYLKNLGSLAWGSSEFSEIINMLIEGQASRDLLAQLGYVDHRGDGTAKPLPFLLQLIWRHYHTRLDASQLIDGQPLSETARIEPYDAAHTLTYVDWLLANVADAAALEAQDFGAGVPRPGALLYLMLHFAIVMENSRAIRGWLGARGVAADELVRSRKFMNIGVEPSPSVWEVFRAPANRIAEGETLTQPLLTVVNTPSLAGDPGQPVAEQRAAIDALRLLPTARLERTLVEHIDTLGYRLDAWETSLFARRLAKQRKLDAAVAERRTGVYLGGYGYLEHVRPSVRGRTRVGDLYEEAGNGGFVHAPSLNHATAAALLRSGYLTHATPDDPNALAVNLSSSRVQRARVLVEGIRRGQSLETLLGVQFERGLHDFTTRSPNPVILDQLKPAFRAAFPILLTRIPQAADVANGASVVAQDYGVVNGLTLARTTVAFPYGISELSLLSAAQQEAIRQVKSELEDTLDALRDVLTTESAYQLALGNFDRAAAVLQSIGNGTVPPDIESIATPRGTGIAFTQRLAVQLSAAVAVNPWAPVPLTERARLEPALNAWLGNLLGDPANIRCTVAAVAPDGTVLTDGGTPIEGIVALSDLAVQPIDFVYSVRPQTDANGAAELESRIRYRFASDRGIADDAIVRISFADAGADPMVRSFAETLPLADRLRRLLGSARPLDARHFRSATADAPAPVGNPGQVNVPELLGRVTTRLAAVRALIPTLQTAADAVRSSGTASSVAALRAALLAIANAGIVYAVPQSASGAAQPQVDALLAQATAVLSRLGELDAGTDAELAGAAAAASAEQAVSILSDAVKTWMGADVLLLPRFTFPNEASVASADAARDELLSYAKGSAGMALPAEEWLHGTACVRPLVHDFEMVRVMADAVRDTPLPLSPLQLPFRAGDRWLGVQYPPDMEVLHDTVSIVQHLPQGFTASGDQCGLLIDEWVESVPNRAEVTGIAFNFNAPNSAPPQALLLAVTPNETGSWRWDDLVDSVLDTFRRAKLRAVEPDAIGNLPGIGTLLPAVIAEFSTSRGSVSLDYSFNVKAIREPVLAMTSEAGG